jgi:signal transduction histidine kinase/DNA-binding response OmpR family regulator
VSSINRPVSCDNITHTLLIVDDNPNNLTVVADYLKRFGFNIIIANSGEVALERVQLALPDVILLDVMMPGIDGFETCRQLKANQHTQDIPVIFMTALTDTENKVKGFEVGGVDYVTKPLQYSEVLARVNTHVRIRDLTRNLQDQNEQLQALTGQLRRANEVLSRKAIQLETSNRMGQQVTSILDLGELLTEVTELIRVQFDYYFVGVWLYYESKDCLVLQACTGGDSQLLEHKHFLSLTTDNNVITQVCRTTKPYGVTNIDQDNLYYAMAELPEARSQLALPLRIGDEKIGVLDIQDKQPAAFAEDEQKVLQTLANQIAIAIRNARMYEMERRISADKDKFFSIISHDLRGPFTSLLGNAQLMQSMADELSADDIRHMSGAILGGSKAALSLLDNLLTWSRMQRSTTDLFPQEIHLRQLAQDTVELLEQTAAIKEIKLENAIDDEVVVYADKYMVDTVLRNLTSNALKFTARGGQVTILAQQNNGAESIRVSVLDTGVGMNPADMEKLFRLDTNHSTLGTEKEQGTGLGLIICKEMVERNNGKIWMESQEGMGTSVQFTLPTPAHQPV